MSASVKDLVFASLMLDLKRWGVRAKSIDEDYLAMNLLIKGMPDCCSRQLVGVESVCRGESVALCEL